jgi:hypothetical protein
MKSTLDLQLAIQNLDTLISKSSNQFSQWVMTGEDWFDPSWLIESCFLQLLTVAEALDLSEFRKMAYEEYATVKGSKNGFSASGVDPDGEPYSPVIVRIRCYTRVLENLFPGDKKTTVTKDLLQIIRDIHYVITDTVVFEDTPANEKDVHLRIEAILKCVFPDLKHKPTLTKQIKNFEPDTGIPSIQTLIEYKFLSSKTDIGPIADQLLADTRGYTSKDWSRFLYVIYETNRFRTESDWNLFLRESGVPSSTTIVVLGGEPSAKEKVIHRRKRTKDLAQQRHAH